MFVCHSVQRRVRKQKTCLFMFLFRFFSLTDFLSKEVSSRDLKNGRKITKLSTMLYSTNVLLLNSNKL